MDSIRRSPAGAYRNNELSAAAGFQAVAVHVKRRCQAAIFPDGGYCRRARPQAAARLPRRHTICGRSSHSSVQAAPERSCSWTSAWCMPPSCVALKRASVTSTSAATGFCLCGMAEEPPPPASSISSPACASSAMSCPNLPSAAGDQRQDVGEIGEAVALAVPLRRVGEAQVRCASAARTGCCLAAQSVQAFPPHRRTGPADFVQRCLAEPFGSARNGACQAATRSETVIGDGRLHARVRHQRVGSEALGQVARDCGAGQSSRLSRTARTGFSRSIRLVSMTSWLVAPKWTCRACGSPTAWRNWRTSSGTTTPSTETAMRSLLDIRLKRSGGFGDARGGLQRG